MYRISRIKAVLDQSASKAWFAIIEHDWNHSKYGVHLNGAREKRRCSAYCQQYIDLFQTMRHAPCKVENENIEDAENGVVGVQKCCQHRGTYKTSNRNQRVFMPEAF